MKKVKYPKLAMRIKKAFLRLTNPVNYIYTPSAAQKFAKASEYFMEFQWVPEMTTQDKINTLFECLSKLRDGGKEFQESIFVSSILWNKWLPNYIDEQPIEWLCSKLRPDEKMTHEEIVAMYEKYKEKAEESKRNVIKCAPVSDLTIKLDFQIPELRKKLNLI